MTDAVISAVLAEVETLRAIDPNLVVEVVAADDYERAAKPPRAVAVRLLGEHLSTPPMSDEPPMEALVRMLYELQDGVVEALWSRGLDPVWPSCLPDHPHPADARAVEGRPMWTCPTTHEVVRPMFYVAGAK